MNFIFLRFMEVWTQRAPCKVNVTPVTPFGRHLFCTWSVEFILPWTSEKWNLFLKWWLMTNLLSSEVVYIDEKQYDTLLRCPRLWQLAPSRSMDPEAPYLWTESRPCWSHTGKVSCIYQLVYHQKNLRNYLGENSTKFLAKVNLPKSEL